jgi:hypothetical protein
MSDPLNDFSQPDADLQSPDEDERGRTSDDLETGLVGESDATGDAPALDDMEEDDEGTSLRDL